MNKKTLWLSGPYLIWITGFILLPLLTIIFYAFTERGGNFTFSNIVSAVTDTANLKALGLTLLLAASATLIGLVLAYPLAICLSKLKLKKKNFIIFLLR